MAGILLMVNLTTEISLFLVLVMLLAWKIISLTMMMLLVILVSYVQHLSVSDNRPFLFLIIVKLECRKAEQKLLPLNILLLNLHLMEILLIVETLYTAAHQDVV
jgi:hypothetical protein